jgi:hypothetical protein
VVPTFMPMHSRTGLLFNPQLPLVGGLDPGIGGTAIIFGQEDHRGRLNVVGELQAEGVGAARFIADHLQPYLRQHFPGAQVVIAPDPSAANRSQTDERAVVDLYRKHFAVKIETNNHLTNRLSAIEHYTTRLIEGGPALWVDVERCPRLIRALRGGWKFQLEKQSDGTVKPVPVKNTHSHTGDAFGYLARYFHRQQERNGRMTLPTGARPLPRPVVPQYHFR